MQPIRKSSFNAQLVSPVPHKTLAVNSPTITSRRKDSNNNNVFISNNKTDIRYASSEDLLALRTPMVAPPASDTNEANERNPVVSMLFEDDAKEREMYQEAEEEFRELMVSCYAHNALYSFSGDDGDNVFDGSAIERPSMTLSDSGDELFALEDVEDLDMGFPRLGHSPAPPSDSHQVPIRAPNPITKNQLFGSNGEEVLRKVKKTIVPPRYQPQQQHQQQSNEDFIEPPSLSSSWTAAPRRSRNHSEPNRVIWHSQDDWVQCC